MSEDILRVESNERVDIGDFESIPESIQAHERQMVDSFLCDPARTRKWVLSGFEISNPAPKQLQVDKGKAILGQRIGGAIQYGVLATEGDASLTVDLNAYAPGVYGVYIRFERIAGEPQSRVFWDPSGAGSEYSQSINTRYTAAWSMRVEAGSPGDDWMHIADVDQATMNITDKRELFFEGNVFDAGAGSYLSGWSSEGGGIANDRNADRASYGATDLQMFGAAVRQCLTDIRGRGLREWYEKGIGGMNVGFDTDPVEGVLAVGDADFNLAWNAGDPKIVFDTGTDDHFLYDRGADLLTLTIGGVDTYGWDASSLYPQALGIDMGKATNYFAHIYGSTLHPSVVDGAGCADHWKPTGDDSFDLGSAGREWRNLYLDGIAFIDLLSPSVAAGEGLGDDLFPSADSARALGDSAAGLSAGTDRRFTNLFLSNGWQVEKAAGNLDLNMYCGGSALDEKWWQFHVGTTGVFSLIGLDDLYANPVTIFSVDRTAVIDDGSLFDMHGQIWATKDSGAAPYDPVVRLQGVNPFLLFADDDAGINAAHAHWGLYAKSGAGDVGGMEFAVWDTAGNNDYAWLSLQTAAGAVTGVEYISMRASVEIGFGDASANGVVTINNDGDVAPSSNDMLGLTRGRNLWVDGTGVFTIKGVTGAGIADSTGFVKIWVKGVLRYVPFFDVYQ